jgi:hypothetical protein
MVGIKLIDSLPFGCPQTRPQARQALGQLRQQSHVLLATL